MHQQQFSARQQYIDTQNRFLRASSALEGPLVGEVNPQDRYKHVNAVLIRPEVGKVRTPIHNLPAETHVYGKWLKRDDNGGAKAAINEWKLPEHSPTTRLPIDYQRVNRISVQRGLFNAKQVAEFRKSHDIRVQPAAPRILQAHGVVQLSLPEASFTYGRKNRPPTPMDLVMKYQYQVEGDRQRLQQYHEKVTAERERRLKHRRLHGSQISRERLYTQREDVSNDQDGLSKNRTHTMSVHDDARAVEDARAHGNYRRAHNNSYHNHQQSAVASSVRQDDALSNQNGLFKMERFKNVPPKISFRAIVANANPVAKLITHLHEHKQGGERYASNVSLLNDNQQGQVVHTLPSHLDM